MPGLAQAGAFKGPVGVALPTWVSSSRQEEAVTCLVGSVTGGGGQMVTPFEAGFCPLCCPPMQQPLSWAAEVKEPLGSPLLPSRALIHLGCSPASYELSGTCWPEVVPCPPLGSKSLWKGRALMLLALDRGWPGPGVSPSAAS